MPNKTSNDQTAVLVAIKKLEVSLKNEISKGDNALRAEMKSGNKAIRQEMLKIEERVENLEGKHGEIDKKLDRLQITLDGFAGNVGKLTEENVIRTKHYRNHEERISKLEKTGAQV